MNSRLVRLCMLCRERGKGCIVAALYCGTQATITLTVTLTRQTSFKTGQTQFGLADRCSSRYAILSIHCWRVGFGASSQARCRRREPLPRSPLHPCKTSRWGEPACRTSSSAWTSAWRVMRWMPKRSPARSVCTPSPDSSSRWENLLDPVGFGSERGMSLPVELGVCFDGAPHWFRIVIWYVKKTGNASFLPF